jgi:hypothetical protein
MPTSLIPIIARTNTIDEWRIQTNKSATDLNDLGFYTYDKTQGTLLLSNTSILNITANGTPLQVANNVLFQSSLTLGNTLFLGVQSSATGNIIAGGTVSVRGPGSALSVSNNSYVGVDLQVVNNIYANNYTANGTLTVANNLTVSSGTLRLNGTGNVAYVNSGSISANTIYITDTLSTNVKTSNLYSLFAKIDVLDDLAFAEIGILENVTGNSYYLSSNTHTSYSVTTRYLNANVSANISNLLSNSATLNTSTILSGNVVSLLSNSGTINNLSVNTSTTLVGNVVSLISQSASLNNSTVNNSTVLVGNVVSLTSNSATLNVATINTSSINVLSTYNLTSTHRITANNIITNNVEVSTINAAWVNVSSNLWMNSGSQLRIFAPNDQYDSLIVDGKATINTAYVTNNLTVAGTWTALGTIEYETDEIVLNKRTPTNASATIRNERPVGNDALIQWNEIDDSWVISKGNTYSQLYAILDSSLLNSQVDSLSTSNISTPLAVNTAHSVAQTSGRYANSAYIHANASFNWANSVSVTANANTARLTTDVNSASAYSNAAYQTANSAGIYANSAFLSQNTTALYANSAFAAANLASLQGGVISGGYANAAFSVANTANQRAISAGVYANGAFSTANTAAVSAALSQSAAESAALYANGAFAAANNATDTWVRNAANSASSYANSAFGSANNAVVKTGQANQTLTGNLSVVGRVETNDIKFNTGTALLQGSTFVLNANQNQNQSPSLSATIEVDRGVSANAVFRYNEVIDKWEFTNNGTDFAILNSVVDRANTVTGGAANKILYQSAIDTTSFIDAPVTQNYFLKWTGSAFTWSDVPSADLTNLNATNLTSGLLPTARVAKTNPSDGLRREYPMHINGDAAYATLAGSATTAGSATSATNATNVVLGGSVITGTDGLSATTYGIRNYGHTRMDGRVYIAHNGLASGTPPNRNDPSNTASLKILGDIAVSNDVYANTFYGVATSARYADLAEKYLPDAEYPIGTLLMIGGEKEVTAAKITQQHSIVGVVSEKPALLMNSELSDGVSVALKGRIPVRIIGTCSKGDLLTISEESGIMVRTTNNTMPIRVIALENKNNQEEGLIEAALL